MRRNAKTTRRQTARGAAVTKAEQAAASALFSPTSLRVEEYLAGGRENKLTRFQVYRLRKQASHWALDKGVLRKCVKGKWLRVLRTPLGVKEVAEAARGRAHYKRGEMVSNLNSHFWWPGEARTAAMDVIQQCKRCLEYDPRNTKVVPPMQHVAFKPEVWNLIAIDLKRLPTSKSSTNYMAIVVDYFSKYVIAGALPTKEATSVCRFLLDSVFWPHGSARSMLSENGYEFKSAPSVKILDLMQVT